MTNRQVAAMSARWRRDTMRSGRMVVGIVAAVLAWVGSASAAPILDFGVIASTAGSVSYATAGGALVGSGIPVDQIVGLGTSSNSGVAVTCVNCTLNFTTGVFAGSSSPTQWDFNPGGSLQIVGGVDFGNDGTVDIPVGTMLLSGSFFGKAMVLGSDNVKVATGGFQDMKDAALLAFFGLPANVGYQGGFNLQFWGRGDAPGTFASTQVRSGDFVNSPVPEPATMLLFGSGLLAAGLAGRRGRKVADSSS